MNKIKEERKYILEEIQDFENMRDLITCDINRTFQILAIGGSLKMNLRGKLTNFIFIFDIIQKSILCKNNLFIYLKQVKLETSCKSWTKSVKFFDFNKKSYLAATVRNKMLELYFVENKLCKIS